MANQKSKRKTDFTKKQLKKYNFQNFNDYREKSRGTKFNLESGSIRVEPGTRYVFFSSLGSQSQQIYKSLRSQGEGLVNSAAAALVASQEGKNNTQQLQKIQSYIELIGQAASNELNLQHNFLEKLIAKTKNEALKKFIDKNKELIDPANKKFDYVTFIVALNKFSTQIDDFTKKRRKILLDNSRLIEDNIKDQEELSNNIRDELRSAMDQGYGQYQKKLKQHDLLRARTNSNGNQKKFNSGIHNIIAQKLTSILNQISKDKDIIATLETDIISLLNGTVINDEQIAMQITAAVLNYLLQNFNDVEEKSSQVLKENFLKSYQEKINSGEGRIYTDKEIQALSNIIIKKVVKPFEYQALVVQKNVGDLFNQLDKTVQSDIIKEYSESYGLNQTKINELLKKLNASTTNAKKAAGIKGHLTKLLKQAIFKKYKGFQTLTLKARKEKLDQLIKEGQMTFTPAKLKESVSNALQIKIQSSGLSQNIQAQLLEKVTDLLTKNGSAKVMGTKIKMKTDIGITYKLGQIKGLDSKEAIEKIEKQLGSFTEKFVTRYSEKTNNQINVNTAKETYLQQRKKIIDEIREQAKKQGVDPTIAIESIEDFFFSEISQKEYTKGGNFGFEGASLGGGGAPQAVLNNISAMYETGGISPVDKDLLYFAAINCSSAALGASLKVPLQHYLLGGAALMMFDSGFTATTHFLQQMKSYLGISNNSHGSLHLFSLQGGNLIPASYLYSSIYNALLAAYQGIISEVAKPLYETAIAQGSASNRVIVTNNLSEANIPDFTITPNAQERWDYISGLASSSVNISFTFLGGMLDIFEAIANAFNI